MAVSPTHKRTITGYSWPSLSFPDRCEYTSVYDMRALIKGWVVGYSPHVSIHNSNLDLQLRECKAAQRVPSQSCTLCVCKISTRAA